MDRETPHRCHHVPETRKSPGMPDSVFFKGLEVMPGDTRSDRENRPDTSPDWQNKPFQISPGVNLVPKTANLVASFFTMPIYVAFLAK